MYVNEIKLIKTLKKDAEYNWYDTETNLEKEYNKKTDNKKANLSSLFYFSIIQTCHLGCVFHPELWLTAFASHVLQNAAFAHRFAHRNNGGRPYL